ncbi:MAG: matrixin family metalloprotease [Polyangiaceae bacterium]
MMKPTLVAGLSACLVLLAAAPSFAFCRTRTCEFDQEVSCEENPVTRCSTVGVEAYWGVGCIPFAIQRDGSRIDGISADELRVVVQNGFDMWTNVSCGNGTPSFSVFDRGDIGCSQIEYNCDAGDANNNIIMFRDSVSELENSQLALSILTANLETGEIFDVDIEINSRDWNFDTGGERSASLATVMNHELGHLLGLSHSLERNALMRASYSGSAEPGSDDIAGVCDIFPRSTRDPACNIEPLDADAACVGSKGTCRVPVQGGETSGGCALGAAPSPSGLGSLAALVLIGLASARARRGRSEAA